MMTPFDEAVAWLRAERVYQTTKFDYEAERDRPTEHWVQQFDSYAQRIPLFGCDTLQGVQAILKLAATAVACAEHYIEKHGSLPTPGVPSGELSEWR